jgi:hypothetical protein
LGVAPWLVATRRIPELIGELREKAEALRKLLERWTCPEPHGHETAQPSAPPNGGPATPPGNSGVTEGPPSVS